MFNIFSEDRDLLELVQLESLLKPNDGTNLKIHRIECIDKIVQTMKRVINNYRYNADFKGAINIKYDESQKSVVGTYDCLDYSRNFRNDEKLQNEWDGMMKSYLQEVNGEIEKLGYHIKLRSDDKAYEGTIYVARYKEDKDK